MTRAALLLALLATATPARADNPLAPRSDAANPLAPRRASDPLVGRWKGAKLELELRSTPDGQYEGSLSFQGQSFPIRAALSEGRLSGSFESGGDRFPLAAKVESGRMTLSSGGADYSLTQETTGPANPLGGGKASTANESAANPLLTQGVEYRHPFGFTFRHPKGWKVQKDDSGSLLLVPPQHATSPQGPLELYTIGGESAEGITDPMHQQVTQYLDQLVAQLFPFLSRQGKPVATVAGAGKGSLHTWEGTNPMGQKVRARVRVSIMKGYAVTLISLGLVEHVEKREPDVKNMFRTFGFGEAAKDPLLVGTWGYQKTYISGGFSSIDKRTLVLSKDGQFLWTNRVLFSNDDDTGSSTGDTGKTRPEPSGRWYAQDKKLVLVWNDDSVKEYSYYVKGQPGAQKMLLKSGGEKELWTQR